MISYDTCRSLSDLFYSVEQPLDPSMLLHMALICSFSLLSNIPLCICPTSYLSIPPCIDVKVPSVSWLSSTVLQWPLVCMYLSEIWFSPNICPRLYFFKHQTWKVLSSGPGRCEWVDTGVWVGILE